METNFPTIAGNAYVASFERVLEVIERLDYRLVGCGRRSGKYLRGRHLEPPHSKVRRQWKVPARMRLAGAAQRRSGPPMGIARDRGKPEGNVLVTDTGNKRGVVFVAECNYLYEFGSTGEEALEEPVGIAVGKDGEVYIADTWNLRVMVFSPDG